MLALNATPKAPIQPERRRRHRRLLAAIALAVGLVVAIALAEVLLRVFDPIGLAYEGETLAYFTTAVRYDWERLPPAAPPNLPKGLDLDGRLFAHKPDLDVSIGSFRVRTNAHGCRGPDLLVPKPDDVFRILLLGDSVTFGWGVEDEVTFARRLETEWNAGGHATRLEVVNTALPKYDTNQEAATLRELGLSLQPDLVLLFYVTNDLAEPSRDIVQGLLTGQAAHPEEQVEIPQDTWSWIAATLQPVLPAIGALLGTRTSLENRVGRILPAGQSYAPETFAAGPRGWARSREALLAIRAMCEQADVPLVLFDHTLPRVESLPRFCREHDIAYEPFFLLPEDYELGITNSWLDSHANAKGHHLMLERLRAALLRRELLPRN